MVAHIRVSFALSFALICFTYPAQVCFGQENPSAEAEPMVEAADCPPLPVFPQLAMAIVVSCQKGDSVEVTMPLTPDAQGRAREKTVRGTYDFREYRIRQAGQEEQVFDNLTQLAPMAGFIVKYSGRPSVITARNGDTWILINVSGESYNIQVVRNTPTPWTPVKNADEISQEMKAHNRVAIYGIQFSPEDQSIQDTQSGILSEVLKYLKQNRDVAAVIESHKASPNRSPQDDLKITEARANAVVAWLVANGIAPARLRSKAFGRNNPVTENDTPQEIARNERIVLAKAEN